VAFNQHHTDVPGGCPGCPAPPGIPVTQEPFKELIWRSTSAGITANLS